MMMTCKNCEQLMTEKIGEFFICRKCDLGWEPPYCASVPLYDLEKRKQEPKPGSTYHAPGCDCGFCKMGTTRF